MLEHIPHAEIEKLLTKNQVETLFLRYEIISKINRDAPLDPQFRILAASFTRAGYPLSASCVKLYYFKYKDL